MVHDRDAGAQLIGLVHVVGRQHDRAAAGVVLADDFPEEQAGLRVEPGRRLIEEEDLGVVHHGARDRETLHHAAGESAGEVVGAVGELESLEELSRAAGSFRRGKSK